MPSFLKYSSISGLLFNSVFTLKLKIKCKGLLSSLYQCQGGHLGKKKYKHGLPPLIKYILTMMTARYQPSKLAKSLPFHHVLLK